VGRPVSRARYKRERLAAGVARRAQARRVRTARHESGIPAALTLPPSTGATLSALLADVRASFLDDARSFQPFPRLAGRAIGIRIAPGPLESVDWPGTDSLRPEGDTAGYADVVEFRDGSGSVVPTFTQAVRRIVAPDEQVSAAFFDGAMGDIGRHVVDTLRRQTEEILTRVLTPPPALLDPGYAVPLSWPPLPDANLDPRAYFAVPGELPAGVTPEAAASASDTWRAGRATPLDDVMSIRARMREVMGEIPGPPPRLCDCPLCNPRPPDPVRMLTLDGVTLFPSPYDLRLAGIGADLDTARSRARAVARTTLGEARWADLARDGYLEVRDHLRPELLYRLTPGRAIEVYDDGHFASYLCVGPAVAMPVDEAFAQLYLYARDAPDELRRRGNWVEQSFRTPNAF
jgi:hypothetical protein